MQAHMDLKTTKIFTKELNLALIDEHSGAGTNFAELAFTGLVIRHRRSLQLRFRLNHSYAINEFQLVIESKFLIEIKKSQITLTREIKWSHSKSVRKPSYTNALQTKIEVNIES